MNVKLYICAFQVHVSRYGPCDSRLDSPSVLAQSQHIRKHLWFCSFAPLPLYAAMPACPPKLGPHISSHLLQHSVGAYIACSLGVEQHHRVTRQWILQPPAQPRQQPQLGPKPGPCAACCGHQPPGEGYEWVCLGPAAQGGQ